MIDVVCALAANRVIGRDGGLPWHLPGDLRRFKELTLGRTVVMGRRTWESLPDAVRPLPGRRNLVVTSTPIPGIETFASLADALTAADGDASIIGGERIFAEALRVADTLHLTEIDGDVDGDARFPELTPNFVVTAESDPISEGGHTYRFRTYERTSLYHLDAARSLEQRAYMEELEASGTCIFCPGHQQPLRAGEHWYVTRNKFPYAGTTEHLLLVPHRHVTSFDQLPDEAGAELWAIRRELVADLQPTATATVERSGDMRFNGGSVAHLHVHLVTLDDVPDPPVRFRVSGN